MNSSPSGRGLEPELQHKGSLKGYGGGQWGIKGHEMEMKKRKLKGTEEGENERD